MDRVAVGDPVTGPVVYVVQDDPKKNFVPALKYGRVEILLEAGDRPVLNPANITKKLFSKLHKMGPDDYLVAVGCPVAIGMAAAIADRVTGGRFHMLKWDNQERAYFDVTLDSTNIPRR